MINFSFDILLCYMYVGLVCALVIALVRNRSRATKYKETVDKRFSLLTLFFIIFCLLDAAWGIVGSPSVEFPRILFVIMTYAFHFMAATSSLVASYYGRNYLNLSEKTKKAFAIFSCSLFVIQIAFVAQNIFTGSFFEIDEAGVYHSHPEVRYVSFYLQICQYLPLIVSALVKWKSQSKTGSEQAVNHYKSVRYLSASSLIFNGILILFCLLQMFYPDGPFYSLGFMVTSVAIYIFNLSSAREEYLKEYHIMETEKKSREQIEKALEEAETANEAKTIFLANMSHDIRTPINGIMGMCLLAGEKEMPDDVRHCIDRIGEASSHLLSLVNDVLDMSKIESGKIEVANNPINLISVFDSTASIVEGQLIGRDMTFVRDYSSISHKNVFGDELRLKQIFINILNNSVKFTKDGGTISFTVENVSETDAEVTYRFIFSDTGMGMKKEFLDDLYKPFAQEAGGSRTSYKGTGLGMSICKQLVELMRGTIDVETEYGVGTTFTIVIPFVKDIGEKEETENEAVSEIKLNGLKVLLAEDNELNMEIAESILTEAGINVTKAYNGKEAADIFASSEPGTFDIILMDIMMPVLNGYEATAAIRSLERADAKEIPILAMTANAFDEDKKHCIEAGMNSHIAKPIDFEYLFMEMKRLVKIRGGGVENVSR